MALTIGNHSFMQENKTGIDIECGLRNGLDRSDPKILGVDEIIHMLENPFKLKLHSFMGEDGNLFVKNFGGIRSVSMLELSMSLNGPGGVLDAGEDVVVASPLLMAIYLKRYELVYGLIDAGYSVVTETKGSLNEDYQEEIRGRYIIGDIVLGFTLGQFIMYDPDMPDELRLYLWHCLAEERLRYSKKQKVHREKAIDFSMINFQKNFCGMLFDYGTNRSARCAENFARVLKMISKRRPRYLKNIIGRDMNEVLNYAPGDSYIELMCFLYDKVAYTTRKKKRLLDMDTDVVWIDSFHQFNPFEKTPLEIIAILFTKMDKRIGQDEELRQSFFLYMLRILNRYVDNSVADNLDTDKPAFKKIAGVFRKYRRKDFSLREYLETNKGITIRKPDWLTKRLELYKLLNGKKIVIDDSIDLVEADVCFGNFEVRADEKVITVPIPYDTNWVTHVDGFVYSDEKSLNNFQKYALKTYRQDTLTMALKKGLLRGRHIECGLEYCMRDVQMRQLIPCIIAHT